MNNTWFLKKPAIMPPLEPEFKPAALANREFRKQLAEAGNGVPVKIALERAGGAISTYETSVFPETDERSAGNRLYIERIVKFLLWQRGGWRIIFGGPKDIGDYLKQVYSPGGERAFDADLMKTVYGKDMQVDICDISEVPASKGNPQPIGGHLDGCRIGFDLGASDRKVAAVIDGEPAYSEEVVWDPKGNTDPQYHYNEIMSALKTAASHMPKVDAIGGSSAGIYVDNEVRVASLFRGVPKDLFEKRVVGLFHEIRKEWDNIPFEVINDGEVTALAGAMSLNVKKVLGVAMGSSEAVGYVDPDGNITGWLDELAFAPFDYNPEAPVDEWSGEKGCGAQYLCQVGVNRLATPAGIELDENKTLAERLKDVQALMNADDPRAQKIFETIGCYFGYALAHYADFYDMEHVLVLGRVTSGKGGDLIIKKAEQVLKEEFPELAGTIKLVVPDEKSRRVGQAVAAASLPTIK